jgi:hypothetical protein
MLKQTGPDFEKENRTYLSGALPSLSFYLSNEEHFCFISLHLEAIR